MEEHGTEVVPRDFLCCSLCQEEYQEPKFLPCLHSFCKACIDDHIEATNCPDDGSYQCPVCATQISPPARAVSQEDEATPMELPDNVFARRLSCPLIVQGKRDRSCFSCEARQQVRTEATTHCINCDEFLCGQCSMDHLSEKETASHKTQPIHNFLEVQDPQQPMHQSDFDPLMQCCHLYDALDIGSTFCVDCDMTTCAECHAKSHADHRCAELSAIAHNFESKIKDPMNDLKRDNRKLLRDLTYLNNAKRYVTKKQQELKSQAKQRSKMLWSLIQQYENILVLEIEKRHAKNMSAIEAQTEVIRKHLASIDAVTDFTDKLLTFGSQEEKVSMRRQIGRRVRELCEGELPRRHIELNRFNLSEPIVTVESICDMFGELTSDTSHKQSRTHNRKPLAYSNSIDLGSLRRPSQISISSADDIAEELGELTDYDEAEDTDMLSASNTSDVLRSVTRRLSTSGGTDDLRRMSQKSNGFVGHLEIPRLMSSNASDSSFQSSIALNDVPCHNLNEAKLEMHFPDVIAQECIKGVGITPQGDIVVATVCHGGINKIFILEKRGIVRGQIPVEKNWVIHSVSGDGKVSQFVARSDNRYKVKVMTSDNKALVDAHIESYGLSGIAATKSGRLLVTSTRYAANGGRSAVKLGGNVTIFEQDSTVQSVITNDSFKHLNMYLFDRPHNIAVDKDDNFFIADPGRHSVIGFNADGTFMFEYGNTDAEEELYQGPDTICTDRHKNVIVLDRKDGRIDILNYEGQLQRCYFPSEHIRFVCANPDSTLLLVNSDGQMKFYDYME